MGEEGRNRPTEKTEENPNPFVPAPLKNPLTQQMERKIYGYTGWGFNQIYEYYYLSKLALNEEIFQLPEEKQRAEQLFKKFEEFSPEQQEAIQENAMKMNGHMKDFARGDIDVYTNWNMYISDPVRHQQYTYYINKEEEKIMAQLKEAKLPLSLDDVHEYAKLLDRRGKRTYFNMVGTFSYTQEMQDRLEAFEEKLAKISPAQRHTLVAILRNLQTTNPRLFVHHPGDAI